MREMPRIKAQKSLPESPDSELEKTIDGELQGLQADAAELEKHIAVAGERGHTHHAWERIENKYKNFTRTINGLTAVAGAVVVGKLLQDVADPNNLALYESIDWNDIAGRGMRDAAIITAVYAVARVGALLLKRHRESKLEKRANEE